MQPAIPGQANILGYDVFNSSTNAPIDSGTVTAYLCARNGADAGKYWDASGAQWSDSKVSAGAMSPSGGALWTVEIAAGAWSPGVTYDLHGEESGGLNMPYHETVVTWGPVPTGKGGSGWTYTLTDSVTGLPVADAEIWATTDSAGANVVAYDTSNVSGQVTFYLPAGTYYIWRAKAGYEFTNPDTEVIT